MPTEPEQHRRIRLRPSGRTLAAGTILGAGLLGLGVLSTLPGSGFDVRPALAQDYSRAPMSFADLADKVRPAVVSIFTKNGTQREALGRDFPFPELPRDHPFRDFFDQFRRGQPDEGAPRDPRPSRAQGSGFLISADGYVVTNHHVVDKADEIEVTFESDEKHKAKVVGSDPRTDIALLKIEGDKNFKSFLNFASAEPRVGDWVLAVGNPFGLGGTVTAGIVSAGGRDIGSGPYDFLQIDAAVNRGNSGGPAVNLDGQVVGVNTAIFSPSGGNVGIAFAIPSQVARNVVDQLRNSGKVSRGWLGVTIQNIDENIAESIGLKGTKGALVSRILPDGPAAKSELKEEDVILNVNGKEIENSRDLARTIAELAPDADVKVSVFRRGKSEQVNVKLGEFPSNEKFAALDSGETPSEPRELEDLGLSLAPASEMPGSREKDGVAITDVNPASDAADQGLRKGDVILEVGGEKVSTPEQVESGIREARERGRKAVLLQIRSREQQRFVALPLKAEKEGSQ